MSEHPAIPVDISMYGAMVALAHAGWYSSLRLDRKLYEDANAIGLWVQSPYWHGMPTASLNICVGWFSTHEDDLPHEKGVRCAGLKRMRSDLICLWNEQLRTLPSLFPDTVPEKDCGKGFRICQFATPHLKKWLPGGERHDHRFSPAPVNLPEMTPEWLDNHRLVGKPWDFENPASDLARFPSLLERAAQDRHAPFTPAWNMTSLQFSAMSDYGVRNDETWKWNVRNFIGRFKTPAGTVRMKRGHEQSGVSTRVNPDHSSEWRNAMQTMADTTIEMESDVFQNAPSKDSAFMFIDSPKA